MTASKNVHLVSKDGEHEVVLHEEDDVLEIGQYRALGFATKAEHAAAKKAAEKAEAATAQVDKQSEAAK